MKKYILMFSVSILALALFACTAKATPTAEAIIPTQAKAGSIPQTEADVPRISVEDAKAAFDSGQAIIVDVRSATSYSAGHAVGAISIPLDNFENNIGSLSLEKDQWIITYCTWQNEHTSARAAFLLLQNGYVKVDALLGGLAAWADAGYPLEP